MEGKKLKVLHICTTDKGGAGLCCLRIHKALLEAGIDSKVLTLNKHNNHVPEVYQFGRFRHYGTWRGLFVKETEAPLRALGLYISDRSRIVGIRKRTGIVTSLPVSMYDLSQNPLVKEADIIHFHWVGNFVDLPSFFKYVHKPIVWTLHDENLFHGIFHYDPGKYKDLGLERKFYELKKQWIHSADKLGIVFISKMMYDQFGGHEMIEDRPKVVINNPVDCNMFRPVKRHDARKQFGIPDNATVFSFVTGRIANPRKGLNLLSATLERMNIPNCCILAVGNRVGYVPSPIVKAVGEISQPEKLAAAYSCSDYFVIPSSQEAFALTPLEAMACGIPVIEFPVSGSDELINKDNGVRADGFTPSDLRKAIIQAMSTKYDHTAIRQDIINRFSTTAISRKYIDFYKKLLENHSSSL